MGLICSLVQTKSRTLHPALSGVKRFKRLHPGAQKGGTANYLIAVSNRTTSNNLYANPKRTAKIFFAQHYIGCFDKAICSKEIDFQRNYFRAARNEQQTNQHYKVPLLGYLVKVRCHQIEEYFPYPHRGQNALFTA